MRARLLLISLATLAACTAGVRLERHDKLQYDDPPTATAPVSTAQPDTAPTPSANPTVTVDASGKLGKICTKIGCQDRYALTVATKDDKAAAAGSYEILMVADGKKLSCKVNVGKDRSAPTCTAGARPAPVDESLPRSVLAALELDATPAALEVTVTRAGKTLSKSTLTPSYKTLQPNGPDCPPVCKHGEDRIAL